MRGRDPLAESLDRLPGPSPPFASAVKPRLPPLRQVPVCFSPPHRRRHSSCHHFIRRCRRCACPSLPRYNQQRYRTRGDEKVWRQTENPPTHEAMIWYGDKTDNPPMTNPSSLPWTSSPPFYASLLRASLQHTFNCDAPGSLRAAGPARTRSPSSTTPRFLEHTAQLPSAVRPSLFAPCGTSSDTPPPPPL